MNSRVPLSKILKDQEEEQFTDEEEEYIVIQGPDDSFDSFMNSCERAVKAEVVEKLYFIWKQGYHTFLYISLNYFTAKAIMLSHSLPQKIYKLFFL